MTDKNLLEQLKTEFVQSSDELGQRILYQPTKRVEHIKGNPQIQDLITQMKQACKGKGIGLAANQIKHSLQIFIIEFQSDKDNPAHTERYDYLDFPSVPLQVFINPKITAASKERVAFWHGCLSAVGWPRGLVATYQWIEYEAFDEHGNQKTGKLDGMGAVIFQHEFLHLLGSLYTDHAKHFIEFEELKRLFKTGEAKPYEQATDTVPLLLNDYIVGESIEDYEKRLHYEKK